MAEKMTAAIVRISDSIAQGASEDSATPFAAQELAKAGVEVISTQIARDDTRDIAEAVQTAAVTRVNLILTIGGTGLSPLDYTARAMDQLFRFDVPGIPEAIRAYALAHGDSLAPLWRGRAGILVGGRQRIFVVNSAGTRSGVEAALAVILPILEPALAKIAGEEE